MKFFISSVTETLREHRKAAQSAFRYLHEDRGYDLSSHLMESNTNTPGPPTSYLDELDECDALLLILGSTYGKKGEDGLSATHREFLRAKSTGKLVIPFHDKHKESYEEDEKRFLAEVFAFRTSHSFDGTPQGLELEIERTLEKLYRGNGKSVPVFNFINDSLKYIASINQRHFLIASLKLSDQIKVEDAKQIIMNNRVWRELIRPSSGMPFRDEPNREYITSTSMWNENNLFARGRIYFEGEIGVMSVFPFMNVVQFGVNSTEEPRLNALNLQATIANIVKLGVQIRDALRIRDSVFIRLMLKSNEKMVLPLVNVNRAMHGILTGEVHNPNSENETEQFNLELPEGVTESSALKLAKDSLIRDVYGTFHYWNPEFLDPFNKI